MNRNEIKDCPPEGTIFKIETDQLDDKQIYGIIARRNPRKKKYYAIGCYFYALTNDEVDEFLSNPEKFDPYNVTVTSALSLTHTQDWTPTDPEYFQVGVKFGTPNSNGEFIKLSEENTAVLELNNTEVPQLQKFLKNELTQHKPPFK